MEQPESEEGWLGRKKAGFGRDSRAYQKAQADRVNGSLTPASTSSVKRKHRARKNRHGDTAKKEAGREEPKGRPGPSDGVIPYLPSMLDRAGRGGAADDATGKFKTHKTYKQNFFPRRSYRAVPPSPSVSRITRCQMPIIFTRRWQLKRAAHGRPRGEGRLAVSRTAKERRMLQKCVAVSS